jgi:hypothetical protein
MIAWHFSMEEHRDWQASSEFSPVVFKLLPGDLPDIAAE